MGIYKKYCHECQSVLLFFFYFFLFRMYKRVNSICIHKPINANIGTEIKNPEMLKFVPDHLKTKQMSMRLKNYLL